MANTDTPKPEEDTSLLALVDATDPEANPPVPNDTSERVEPPPSVASSPAQATPMQATPKQAPAKSASGFLPALLGGAIAAVLGFAASHFDVLQLRGAGFDTTAIDSQLATQAAEAQALKAEVERLSALPAPQPAPQIDPTFDARLSALEAAPDTAVDLTGLQQQLDALTARLAQIEALPIDGTAASPAALAALQAQVDALKGSGTALSADISKMAEDAAATLAQAEAQAAALKDEAAALSKSASALAAIGRIEAALDTGSPFASALADLAGFDVPSVLADHAATGLPTLPALQSSFPDAARAALAAALAADMGQSWSERVGSFLRSQTGARSLAPREGSDPDAVLSRAEAALAKADLATTLSEIATLPEAGKAAMADWLALADLRSQSEAAVTALASAVDSKGAAE